MFGKFRVGKISRNSVGGPLEFNATAKYNDEFKLHLPFILIILLSGTLKDAVLLCFNELRTSLSLPLLPLIYFCEATL